MPMYYKLVGRASPKLWTLIWSKPRDPAPHFLANTPSTPLDWLSNRFAVCLWESMPFNQKSICEVRHLCWRTRPSLLFQFNPGIQLKIGSVQATLFLHNKLVWPCLYESGFEKKFNKVKALHLLNNTKQNESPKFKCSKYVLFDTMLI